MQISLILLLAAAYIIICQDTKEMASGGGVASGGGGGTFTGKAYMNAPSVDSDARIINMDRGRIASVFQHTSPESWQPQQKSAMLNSGSYNRNTMNVPYVEEIQPFNIVK